MFSILSLLWLRLCYNKLTKNNKKLGEQQYKKLTALTEHKNLNSGSASIIISYAFYSFVSVNISINEATHDYCSSKKSVSEWKLPRFRRQSSDERRAWKLLICARCVSRWDQKLKFTAASANAPPNLAWEHARQPDQYFQVEWCDRVNTPTLNTRITWVRWYAIDFIRTCTHGSFRH